MKMVVLQTVSLDLCKGRNTLLFWILVQEFLISFTEKYNAVLFCDNSKAFDCVSHDILVSLNMTNSIVVP